MRQCPFCAAAVDELRATDSLLQTNCSKCGATLVLRWPAAQSAAPSQADKSVSYRVSWLMLFVVVFLMSGAYSMQHRPSTAPYQAAYTTARLNQQIIAVVGGTPTFGWFTTGSLIGYPVNIDFTAIGPHATAKIRAQVSHYTDGSWETKRMWLLHPNGIRQQVFGPPE